MSERCASISASPGSMMRLPSIVARSMRDELFGSERVSRNATAGVYADHP